MKPGDINRRKLALAIAGGVAALTTALSMQARQVRAADPAPISYADDIAPIFKGRCISCHQPGGEGFEKSGLDLTTYAGLMKGTKFGLMVIPGSPDTSNLMWLLDWQASAELRMPHGKKQLSSCDRDTIRSWIREGAKDN